MQLLKVSLATTQKKKKQKSHKIVFLLPLQLCMQCSSVQPTHSIRLPFKGNCNSHALSVIELITQLLPLHVLRYRKQQIWTTSNN